jgi:hypothetical protein
VIPIRADSLDALAEIRRVGLVPDLICIDTEHTYARVSQELVFCTDHWPSSTIVGDDYDWPEFAKAARDHAQKRQDFSHRRADAKSLLDEALRRGREERRRADWRDRQRRDGWGEGVGESRGRFFPMRAA